MTSALGSRARGPAAGLLTAGLVTGLLAAALAVTGTAVAGTAESRGGDGSGEDFGLIDAITLMLSRDPNIAIARSSVEIAQGGLMVDQASFDPELGASAGGEDSETPTSEDTVRSVEAQSLDLTLSKLFRSGLSASSTVAIARTEGEPTSNDGSVSVTLRQPLARGRGRDVTTAAEQASELDLEASQLDLRHRIAERALAVANQYWSVRAAVADLETLREIEGRARDSLATYRRLVEADQVPAADLVQLEADLMSREVARLTGEQILFARRQQLGLEIGLDAVGAAALPLPSDAFPRLGEQQLIDPLDENVLAEARRLRDDLEASRRRLQGDESLNRLARNALLPQVDLVATPSYAGFADGDDLGDAFSSLTDNVPGLSLTFGVSVAWPWWNRAAEGRLQQSDAGLALSRSSIELLENSISVGVTTAIDDVNASTRQLARAIDAVELFRRSVENEQKKLQVGRSTLLDTITQRDRLTSALQRQTSAELSLALALVRLRFQTGTLLGGTGEDVTIDPDHLITLPVVSSPTSSTASPAR